MDRYVDLVIPRGGEGLIRFVCENATVPVVKHDKGVCHVYVDKEGDIQKALDIIINAKCQRPGVCNSMECLLVDEAIASSFLPQAKALFDAQKTVLHGCEKTVKIVDIDLAGDDAFYSEYLANELNIKVVDGIKGAVEHIGIYGSGHSEAIITENISIAYIFTQEVDAACVYVNASTRFTDGAEFGFGAEVGISTNKLHSRGPMGINDLTTYKYIITGEGHTR
jgi:glutamate-5-semialdehyde dehydrogenase